MQITNNDEVAVSQATETTETKGNLSDDDFLGFLAQEDPVAESQVEDVTTDESGVEAEEASEEENVLLQSNDEEDEEDETDETDVLEESEESEESEEPKTPKSVQKLVKQIGKLTSRAKTAEENFASISNELKSLRESKSEEKAHSPGVNEVETFEELETLRKEAINAKKWARKYEGESFVEENGVEYTAEQIKEIRNNSEDCLDELIPARQKFLQERDSSNAQATQSFPFLQDQASEGFKLLSSINENPRFKTLKDLPNELYLKGLLVEGVLSVNSRNTAPKKVVKKTAKPMPPVEPFSEVSPPVKKVKNKSKILGNGNVTEDQLIAFLS